jgi:hypothetical protein
LFVESFWPFLSLKSGSLELFVAENQFNSIELAHGKATQFLLTLQTQQPSTTNANRAQTMAFGDVMLISVSNANLPERANSLLC